ncbi:MAG: AraC family transcriptional regulator [Clostridia bacterium]|nr:AraC family transcriptional regulator [Clostridia bacterium]
MYYEPTRDVTQTARYAYFENIRAPLHFHQAIELVYCLEGSFSVQSGATKYELHQNEIAFFPSYSPHAIHPIQPTKSITYMLPLRFFEPFVNNNIDLIFQKLDNHEVNLKIKALIEDSRPLIQSTQINTPSDLLLQGYAITILGLIHVHYNSALNDTYTHNQRYNKIIIDVIQYIENHYKEQLTLKDIATQFGYSKWYFSRLFNQYFGCSLPTYINSIRCSKIEQKKKSTLNKTYTILDEGFSSLSTYYKAKTREKQ